MRGGETWAVGLRMPAVLRSGVTVHLLRTLLADGPWLQLMPDSAEDCEALEAIAARGVPTCGLQTEAETRRLRGLVDDHMPEEVSERPIDLAIVPRDRPDVARELRRVAANRRLLRWPGGSILPIMDRRRADRRLGSPPWRLPSLQRERRRAERRCPLPAPWQAQGFVIVPASHGRPSGDAEGTSSGSLR